MRYLDTGSRDAAHTLYKWLDGLLPDATYFAAQTGYFSADGIYPLEKEVKELLQRDGAFHLVVGANEASIRSDDLEYVLDLFDGASAGTATSLTIVAADDVLMHPKSYYIESNGHRAALVGSVNLTGPGLARNIEAALAINDVDDPSGPFDDIRDAVLAWSTGTRVNATPIDRATITRLVSEGVLDAPAASRPPRSAKSRTSRKKLFPSLGAIVALPRRRRRLVKKVLTTGAAGAGTTTTASPATVPAGTLKTLPSGYIGIIKRLSNTDTKPFRGEVGTIHIALPKVLASYLPMKPAGVRNEPRVDVAVEARLDVAPGHVITSGSAPTNITHVGMGTTQGSNKDLRFNYLKVIASGVRYAADAVSAPTPKAGDLVAMEFMEGVRIRMTFISDSKSKAALAHLITESRGGWGWLLPDVIESWESEDDIDDR